MGDNRPVRYVEPDGTIVYRASGLGLCDRIYAALDQAARGAGATEAARQAAGEPVEKA